MKPGAIKDEGRETEHPKGRDGHADQSKKRPTKVRCDACGGSGKASDGKSRCPACHGAKVIKVWR